MDLISRLLLILRELTLPANTASFFIVDQFRKRGVKSRMLT